MSLASDRPPASTPMTEQPYSRLPKLSRSQSGARPKVIEPKEEPPASESAPEPATSQLKLPSNSDIPSEVPASLKKPYASLAPAKKAEEGPIRSAAVATATWNDTTEARRWNDTTEARRRLGTCKKHKIALSPQHECLLCKREAGTHKSGLALKMGIALAAIALLALLFILL